MYSPLDTILYICAVGIAGIVGSLMCEWFWYKYEEFMMPLCKKVEARRKYVLERRRKKN
jgi:hypothetical protein